MSQSRRLAAILAADVAGYSRLMGADEEGTLQRLKEIRIELIDPIIATHHGRLVKTQRDMAERNANGCCSPMSSNARSSFPAAAS
jgi:class 3 adenylate cyclase